MLHAALSQRKDIARIGPIAVMLRIFMVVPEESSTFLLESDKRHYFSSKFYARVISVRRNDPKFCNSALDPLKKILIARIIWGFFVKCF